MSNPKTWDYRVIQHADGCLYIHEVYYEGDDPWAWTAAISPLGDDLDDLAADLNHMVAALDKPIIPIEEAEEW